MIMNIHKVKLDNKVWVQVVKNWEKIIKQDITDFSQYSILKSTNTRRLGP